MNYTDHGVSIIVPMFNSEKYIKDCLQSLINQDYNDKTIIVVDNNSNDRSREIAFKTLKESGVNFLLFNEPKQGVSYARNLGIEKATTRYICFLDSDDYLPADSISSRVKHLKENGIYVTYGSYVQVKNGKEVRKIIPCKSITPKNIYKKNHIGNLTGIYDCKKLGKYYQNPIGHEDFDMWLRILSNAKHSTAVQDKILGYYRLTEGSISSNKISAAIWHFKILKNNIKNPIFLFYNFLFYAVSNLKKFILK